MATLLLGEFAAKLLGPYLPAPARWPDEATSTKIAQMDDRECADVVFVGNSMARDAFDPPTFADMDPLGRSAYNASLDAASPAQLARWVPEEVVERLDPSTVVVALASTDLNDNAAAGQAALESYESSQGGRDDLLGSIDRQGAEWSALLRHRASLRDPQAVLDGVSAAWSSDEADRPSVDGLDGLIGPDGEGLSRQELGYTGQPAVQRFVADQLLNDYSLGPEQLDAAEELLARLDRAGIEVVLVALPVTDDYIALHPNGEADYDEYRAAMALLADSADVDFHDLSEATDSFADTHHLNGVGSQELTEATAALPIPGEVRCEESR